MSCTSFWAEAKAEGLEIHGPLLLIDRPWIQARTSRPRHSGRRRSRRPGIHGPRSLIDRPWIPARASLGRNDRGTWHSIDERQTSFGAEAKAEGPEIHGHLLLIDRPWIPARASLGRNDGDSPGRSWALRDLLLQCFKSLRELTRGLSLLMHRQVERSHVGIAPRQPHHVIDSRLVALSQFFQRIKLTMAAT